MSLVIVLEILFLFEDGGKRDDPVKRGKRSRRLKMLNEWRWNDDDAPHSNAR